MISLPARIDAWTCPPVMSVIESLSAPAVPGTSISERCFSVNFAGSPVMSGGGGDAGIGAETAAGGAAGAGPQPQIAATHRMASAILISSPPQVVEGPSYQTSIERVGRSPGQADVASRQRESIQLGDDSWTIPQVLEAPATTVVEFRQAGGTLRGTRCLPFQATRGFGRSLPTAALSPAQFWIRTPPRAGATHGDGLSHQGRTRT